MPLAFLKVAPTAVGNGPRRPGRTRRLGGDSGDNPSRGTGGLAREYLYRWQKGDRFEVCSAGEANQNCGLNAKVKK